MKLQRLLSALPLGVLCGIFSLTTSYHVHAEDAHGASCPEQKLHHLCIAIEMTQKDKTGQHQFNYQKIILDASCVLPDDTELQIQAKVQAMWRKHQDTMVCTGVGFDVQRGSLLKFAVSRRFEDFLFDTAMIWKVDMNKVDESDGRTVLDYTKKELDKYAGTPIERKLRSYYDMLRTSGAKHRSEL